LLHPHGPVRRPVWRRDRYRQLRHRGHMLGRMPERPDVRDQYDVYRMHGHRRGVHQCGGVLHRSVREHGLGQWRLRVVMHAAKRVLQRARE
jgi:hypothetical protein